MILNVFEKQAKKRLGLKTYKQRYFVSAVLVVFSLIYFCLWKCSRENFLWKTGGKGLSPFILSAFNLTGRYIRRFISKELQQVWTRCATILTILKHDKMMLGNK